MAHLTLVLKAPYDRIDKVTHIRLYTGGTLLVGYASGCVAVSCLERKRNSQIPISLASSLLQSITGTSAANADPTPCEDVLWSAKQDINVRRIAVVDRLHNSSIIQSHMISPRVFLTIDSTGQIGRLDCNRVELGAESPHSSRLLLGAETRCFATVGPNFVILSDSKIIRAHHLETGRELFSIPWAAADTIVRCHAQMARNSCRYLRLGIPPDGSRVSNTSLDSEGPGDTRGSRDIAILNSSSFVGAYDGLLAVYAWILKDSEVTGVTQGRGDVFVNYAFCVPHCFSALYPVVDGVFAGLTLEGQVVLYDITMDADRTAALTEVAVLPQKCRGWSDPYVDLLGVFIRSHLEGARLAMVQGDQLLMYNMRDWTSVLLADACVDETTWTPPEQPEVNDGQPLNELSSPLSRASKRPKSIGSLALASSRAALLEKAHLPRLGITSKAQLAIVTALTDLWAFLIETRFTDVLASLTDRTLYDLSLECTVRERVAALYEVYLIVSAVTQLINLTGNYQLLTPLFHRLSNRGRLVESILIRALEPYVLHWAVRRGRRDFLMGRCDLTALPLTFFSYLLKHYTQRFARGLQIGNTVCVICALEHFSGAVLCEGIRNGSTPVCSHCVKRYSMLASTIATQCQTTRAYLLGRKAMQSYDLTPGVSVAVGLVVNQDGATRQQALDHLLVQSVRFRFELLAHFAGPSTEGRTPIQLEQLALIPTAQLMVWWCVEGLLGYALGAHTQVNPSSLKLSNVHPYAPCHLFRLISDLYDGAKYPKASPLALAEARYFTSLLFRTNDIEGETPLVLKTLLSLSPRFTFEYCLIPLMQASAANPSDFNSPDEIYRRICAHINQYILSFATGREQLQSSELPEYALLPADACKRHALDISFLHLWMFNFSADTLANSLCEPGRDQVNTIIEYLVSDVETGLVPRGVDQHVRDRLAHLDSERYLAESRTVEDLKVLEQSLVLALVNTSSISDLTTREAQLLSIFKASSNWETKIDGENSPAVLSCMRDSEALRRTMEQAQARGMLRAAAVLADHDHMVADSLRLYLRLPKGAEPHPVLEYVRTIAFSFRQLVCDPLASKEGMATRRYSRSEVLELRRCIWAHLEEYLGLATPDARLEVVMILLELLKPQSHTGAFVGPFSPSSGPSGLPEPSPDDSGEISERVRQEIVEAFVQLYKKLIEFFPETALPLYQHIMETATSPTQQETEDEWTIIRLDATRQCFHQLVELASSRWTVAECARMLMLQAVELSADLPACLDAVKGQPLLELALLLGVKQDTLAARKAAEVTAGALTEWYLTAEGLAIDCQELRNTMISLWPFGSLPVGGLSLDQIIEYLTKEGACASSESTSKVSHHLPHQQIGCGITAFAAYASCTKDPTILAGTLTVLDVKLKGSSPVHYARRLTQLLLGLNRILATAGVRISGGERLFEHPALRLFGIQVARREEEIAACQASRLRRLRGLTQTLQIEMKKAEIAHLRLPVTVDLASQVSEGNAFCLSQAVCAECGRSILRGDNNNLKAALGRQRYEAVDKALSAIRVDHFENVIRHRECFSVAR